MEAENDKLKSLRDVLEQLENRNRQLLFTLGSLRVAFLSQEAELFKQMSSIKVEVDRVQQLIKLLDSPAKS